MRYFIYAIFNDYRNSLMYFMKINQHIFVKLIFEYLVEYKTDINIDVFGIDMINENIFEYFYENYFN